MQTAAVEHLRAPACTNPQAGGNADELMEQSKALKVKILEMEEKEKAVVSARDKILCGMGNLVHDSVVVSQDEVGSTGMACRHP